MMKHYKFTAAESIAWCRVCRPGSIIGPQQNFLEERQMWLWSQGDAHRSRRKEGLLEKDSYRDRHGISNLVTGVDDLRIHDAVDNDNRFNNYDRIYDPPVTRTQERDRETQGDKLNHLKVLRQHSRSATTGLVDHSEDLKSHRRSATQPLRTSGARSAGASGTSPLKSSKISSTSSSSTLPNHHTNGSVKRTLHGHHTLYASATSTGSKRRNQVHSVRKSLHSRAAPLTPTSKGATVK